MAFRTALRWVFLFLPIILLVPSLLGAGRYGLVLREETYRPVVGVPRLLLYGSPCVAVAYVAVVLLWCRPQLVALFRSPRGKTLTLLLVVLSPVTVWGVGQSLNGLLDGGQPQVWQTQVVGPAQIDTGRITGEPLANPTRYVLLRDWRNPGEHVYLYDKDGTLSALPAGAPFTVTTKRGFFGWEYYTQ